MSKIACPWVYVTLGLTTCVNSVFQPQFLVTWLQGYAFAIKPGSVVAQLRNDDPSYPLSSPSLLSSLPSFLSYFSPPSLSSLSSFSSPLAPVLSLLSFLLSSLSSFSLSFPSFPLLLLFPLLPLFPPPSPLHCVLRELCSAVPRQQTQIGSLCDTSTGTGQPLICCVWTINEPHLWMHNSLEYDVYIAVHVHEPSVSHQDDLDVMQSHLLWRMCFGHYQTTSAALGWLGDRRCYLVQERLSGYQSYQSYSETL